MTRKNIIVIGASAGGIDALKTIAAGLPGDLQASIFITLHVAPYSEGLLPEILSRAGPLPATNARDWEEFKSGHIYVAPPDCHLLFEKPNYLRLSHGPRENRFRPAIDPMFRSAAHTFGSRVIGVVLTGWLDDGAAGLWAIHKRGGTAVVQHPNGCYASAMPVNAIKHVEVEHILPLSEIAPALARLVRESVPTEEPSMPEEMEIEVKISKEGNALANGILKWGKPSIYSCPECHGVLLELQEGNLMRFRCHTGHAYSPDSLLAEFADKTEETLWSALRAIEESIILMKGLTQHSGEEHTPEDTQSLLNKVEEAQERADLVRKALFDRTAEAVGRQSAQ